MKPWKFEQIRRVTLSRWICRGTREFSGRISTDSRQVQEGDFFIAIRGKNHNSHTFIPQVVAAGAAGVLVDQPPDQALSECLARGPISVLQCDNTIRGLNRLAAAYRRELRARIIAVGGSNGKTTTKQMIHTLLSTRFSGIASPKSFNNNIGLPLTLLSVEPQHEYVILEVGTNAPGEVAALGHVAVPDIVVITSVGLEHLEFLGDLESVAREEASLARFVAPGGMLFLTNESPELLAALRLFKAPRFTVGPGGSGADLEATLVEQSMDGLHFVVNGRGAYRLPLFGRHNVFNALLAMGVARRFGLTDEQIAAALETIKPPAMRMEPQRLGGHFVLNDAYNANPASMARALETFAELPFNGAAAPVRRVAILGDMLELGPRSDELHAQVGRDTVRHRLDVFLAVGPLMKHAANAAVKQRLKVHHLPDTAAAMGKIRSLLKPGDAILLKASRGMGLEKLLPVIESLKSK
jgi:UDP-N-acetylmuramoyl-tripeptide--D-alanyl-D-alanine ligase